MKIQKYLLLALFILLPACATMPTQANLPLVVGPAPSIVQTSFEAAASQCVTGKMTKEQRKTTFAVLETPDKTGHLNISGSGDSAGAFTTQGAADMLVTSLKGLGVRIVDISLPFRAYEDWQVGKASLGLAGSGEQNTITTPDGKKTVIPNLPLMKGTILVPDIIITGSITALDFIPGGGVTAGFDGTSASASQNRMVVRIDLRAVRMSTSSIGAEIIATATVEKQIVQNTAQVTFTQFVGPSASPHLVNFSLGGQEREAAELSVARMLDLATADLVAQIFKVKGCQPPVQDAENAATGQVAVNKLQ